MLNFTFIGIKTKAYNHLEMRVQEICKNHAVEAKLNHVNDIDDIVLMNVKSIPSIQIIPGNIVMYNPSYNEIESTILNLYLNKK